MTKKKSDLLEIRDPVLGNFRIVARNNEYTVGKISSKNKPLRSTNKYFTNFAKAVGYVAKARVIKENTRLTMDEYINEYNKIKEEIVAKIRDRIDI